MIRKRLVHLLAHAKKYVFYQVAWQWAALICQIVMIWCAALSAGAGAERSGDGCDGGALSGDFSCGADPAFCL